jgi:Protein of unknown function (DUF2934)
MANGTKLKKVPQVSAGHTVPRGNISAHADELAACLLLRAEIRKRAYELFRERHGAPGRDLDDWLRAEAEVRARHGIATYKTPRVFGGQRRETYAGILA